MITGLWDYFGLVGIASIVVWAVAMFVLVRSLTSPMRTRGLLVATALAVLGVVLAEVNSSNVRTFEDDGSAQQEALVAQRDELRREARDLLAERAARVRFAEDTKDDRLDLAGIDTRTSKSVYELAASGQSEQAEPEYRRRGRQQRDPTRSGAAGDGGEGETAAAAEEPVVVRKMPFRDVHRANRADIANLRFARYTLLFCIIALAGDYLIRSGRTFGGAPPTPLTGLAASMGMRRPQAVYLHTNDQSTVHAYLRDVVRAGESFLYLGESDPLAGQRLHRWSVGPIRFQTLPALTYSPTSEISDAAFLFESVWFGRACGIVIGADDAATVLAHVTDAMRIRDVPHARARRTVHLIWHMPDVLPATVLEDLIRLGRRANCRIVLVSPHALTDAPDWGFDEYVLA